MGVPLAIDRRVIDHPGNAWKATVSGESITMKHALSEKPVEEASASVPCEPTLRHGKPHDLQFPMVVNARELGCLLVPASRRSLPVASLLRGRVADVADVPDRSRSRRDDGRAALRRLRKLALPDKGYKGARPVPSVGPREPLLRREAQGEAQVRVPWEVAEVLRCRIVKHNFQIG